MRSKLAGEFSQKLVEPGLVSVRSGLEGVSGQIGRYAAVERREAGLVSSGAARTFCRYRIRRYADGFELAGDAALFRRTVAVWAMGNCCH